jgi:hypothetical protein
MLLSKRAYARHRAEKGLPGGTLAATQRALREGRVKAEANGKINPELADQMWANNTRVTTPARPNGGPTPKPSAEWLAHEICRTARREWPSLVSGLKFDFVPAESRAALRAVLAILMIHVLEEECAPYLDLAALPPVNWSDFEDAATVERECTALRAEWTAIGEPEQIQ